MAWVCEGYHSIEARIRGLKDRDRANIEGKSEIEGGDKVDGAGIVHY